MKTRQQKPRAIPAKCEIVVKLDRLSRDLEFIGWIQNSSIKFICADMPEATRETTGFMGVMARWVGAGANL